MRLAHPGWGSAALRFCRSDVVNGGHRRYARGSPMITTHALSKWYGSQPAVRDLEIEISAGRVVGFLGPNGAGKSTTLRMIAGYLPPTSGRVLVAGLDVEWHRSRVRRHIGYLPESTPLYPEMRVTEFLRFRARLFRVPRRERRKAIESVITRCWLKEVQRKPIGHLSKGYRQRVGLAAALLHKPAVLLLDEPTSGLDPAQIREMRGLIRELAGEHTILLSTHILSEVEMTCDRVIIIAAGTVRAQGTLAEVRERSAGDDLYTVEIAAAEVPAEFNNLKGLRVESNTPLEKAWRRIVLRSAGGEKDRREEIATVLRSANIAVRELRREIPTLEQVFMRLVEGDEMLAPARTRPDGSITLRPNFGPLAGGTRP